MSSHDTRLETEVADESPSSDLAERLAAFGFAVPQSVLRAWKAEKLHAIQRCVTDWEADCQRAQLGLPKGETERVTVSRELLAYEIITAKLARQARDHGHSAASAGVSLDANPYPPGTALSKIWGQGFREFPP